MPSCVMRFCTNYTGKTSKSQGITYHSFPLNELRRLKWVEIVRKQRKQDDWLPNNSSKICSIHFNNDDKYKSSKGLILLKKSALPVLETSHSSPPAKSCSEERVSVLNDFNCLKMSAASATVLKTTHSLRASACSEVKNPDLKSSNLLKSSALPVIEVSHSFQPTPACFNNLSEIESSNSTSSNILKNSTGPVFEVCHSPQPTPACLYNLSEAKNSDLDLSNILKNSTAPVLEVCHTSQPAPTSPNSLEKERISDMESIFETPRKTALKKCMKKLYLQKQNLINKNRNLTKRNKRLEKKFASMSTILKHLKKKSYISDEHQWL